MKSATPKEEKRKNQRGGFCMFTICCVRTERRRPPASRRLELSSFFHDAQKNVYWKIVGKSWRFIEKNSLGHRIYSGWIPVFKCEGLRPNHRQPEHHFDNAVFKTISSSNRLLTVLFATCVVLTYPIGVTRLIGRKRSRKQQLVNNKPVTPWRYF